MNQTLTVVKQWLRSEIANYKTVLAGNRVPSKLLLLTEYLDATYYLAFYYPLKVLAQRGKVDLTVLSSKQIIQNIDGQQTNSYFKNLLATQKPDVVIFGLVLDKR